MYLLPFLALFLAGGSLADERRHLPIPPAKEYQQECGACHIPYPARMLPPESWRKLMRELDQHFATDATISARETREITDYLVKRAADPRKHGAAPLRITETARFRHEHDEIGRSVIQRPAIKSLANCQACHPRAEQANFDEHEIRIPR